VPSAGGILGKLTLKQILDAQKNQVRIGKTYLNLAQGLLRADSAILQGASTFWGLTINGGLELAQMTIARLYDKTKGAVTVPAMLVQARSESSQFQHGPRKDVDAAISKSEETIRRLDSTIVAVRIRRNEALAHLDARTIADPKALSEKAKLTVPDLEKVLKETANVLLELSSLYDGTSGDLRFVGGHDYKSVLEWIRKAKCASIESYEKEFGATYPGSRPKNFTLDNFKMR
jgi:hypothetical protein